MRSGRFTAVCLGLLLLIAASPWLSGDEARAQEGKEQRIALVIGNTGYQSGALATPANDAGLIAQTLQAAGFDVIGARDLEGDNLRQTLRDFLEKARAAGPETVAFVYLAGHGVQFEGDNYFVPVDARVERDTDVPVQAIRLSDYLRPLAALPLKARFIVLDTARDNAYSAFGNPLASGLALVEPETGSIVAFNAAPGTIAAEGAGPYGAYAQALAEMIRDGGLAHDLVFERVRLRVSDITQGATIPWHGGKIDPAFFFFERAADAPTPVVHADFVERRAKPIRSFQPEEAFLAALDRDTLGGYTEFLETYPAHQLAQRARAISATRREAIVWRRTCSADTADAYWTYLDRYPKGPHAWDARRRLRRLAAEAEPPPVFTRLIYDVPPPPDEEFVYIERRVILYSDSFYGFAPLPRPLLYLLPLRPADFVVLVAPYAVSQAYVLPTPVYVPVAHWVKPHHLVKAPPDNALFKNIHKPVVPTLAQPKADGPGAPGQPPPANAVEASKNGSGLGPIAGAVAVGLAAAALKVALPPGVAKKAAAAGGAGPGLAAGAPPLPKAQSPVKSSAPVGLPIPGQGGLPSAPGLPKTGPATVTGQPPIKPGTLAQPLPLPTPPLPPAKADPAKPGAPAVGAPTATRDAQRDREQATLEQQRRNLARKSVQRARERAAERLKEKKPAIEEKPRKAQHEQPRSRARVEQGTSEEKKRAQHQAATKIAVERQKAVVKSAETKRRVEPVKEVKPPPRKCGGPGLPACP